MIMDNVRIYQDPTGRKRAIAEFEDGKKVRFGQKDAYTYYDGATETKQKAYIARHSKNNENWSRSGNRTPGFFSRWVLWNKTIRNIKQDLQKRGIKLKSMKLKKNPPK